MSNVSDKTLPTLMSHFCHKAKILFISANNVHDKMQNEQLMKPLVQTKHCQDTKLSPSITGVNYCSLWQPITPMRSRHPMEGSALISVLENCYS